MKSKPIVRIEGEDAEILLQVQNKYPFSSWAIEKATVAIMGPSWLTILEVMGLCIFLASLVYLTTWQSWAWLGVGISIYTFTRVIIMFRTYHQVKEENRRDFQQIQAVIRFFQELGQQPVAVSEKSFINPQGTWKPVKSEVYTVQELRASMKGHLSLSGFIGYYSGTFSGNLDGQSQPMLDDMPIVVWLENEQSQVIRLIIPSRHMIVRMLTDFLSQLGKNVFEGTWTHDVLTEQTNQRMLAGLVNWENVMPSYDAVNRLLVACDKPDGEKPKVQAMGREFGTGHLLTAILFDGQESKVVLSSATLDQLSLVSDIIGARQLNFLPAEA